MPYRRTYRRRRPKRNWYTKRRSYTIKGGVQAALAGVKYLKGMVNAEMNVHDSAIDAVIGGAGVTALASIPQGDTESSRNGISLLARRLNCRGTITQHASATNTFFRMIILRDKQQIADTSPTPASILDAPSAIVSQYNNDDKGRFTILHDQTFKFSASGTTNASFNLNFPMQKHIRYNGVNGSDIQKNGLFVLLMSSESTNTPTADLSFRLHYHDN